MAKEVIRLDGIIEESLPDAFFRVKIIDERYPSMVILCKVSGRMQMNFIKIIQGDYVTVEISPYDLKRGRIVYRHRGKPIPSAQPVAPVAPVAPAIPQP